MVFVTVGTHEQPFDRLIKYVDGLKGDGAISEDVIIQTGYSSYEPKRCIWKKWLPYQEMVTNVADAHIVITHGGPSSFIMPLQIGKIPVVVPRRKRYGEHVNDHQVEFCRAVAERQGNIILVEDIEMIEDAIKDYEKIILAKKNEAASNNERFCREFQKLTEDMMKKKMPV